MNTKNKLPLYKRLNEERTQGNWGIIRETETSLVIASDEIRKDNRCKYVIEIKQQRSDGCIGNTDKINAQYTALAVNNLASVAEALENLISVAELNIKGFSPSLEAAKKALNKIS